MSSMSSIFIVGLGGAIGAMGRYLISLLPVKPTFPVLTLITNLLGAVLIGLIVGLSMRKNIQGGWILFWKTGVCGGFTTFSTFSLESLNLFQSGNYVCGGAYVALSVLFCTLGVALGQYLALYFVKI